MPAIFSGDLLMSVMREDNRGQEGNRDHKEKRRSRDEQSDDERGRVRPGPQRGPAGGRSGANANLNTDIVCVCAVSFASLTAGYASRRPHSALRSCSVSPFLL